MITTLDSLEDLKKSISDLNKEIDIDNLLKIDLPFIESQAGFTIMHIPSYGGEQYSNLIFATEKETLIYTSLKTKKSEEKFNKIVKKKYGESTVSMFILLRAVLKNYSLEFLRIREMMNKLELDPVLDSIEGAGRYLRNLTDRLEGLFQIIIELKEDEVKCFNIAFISFDYELFTAEARYWLERCRSHNYRISSLRTKSEMRSNRELNDTMKKLTVIMTFLTIASIVVNVPGTVGAIFGIPALSDTYFKAHTPLLVIVLILTTAVSMVLGIFYWKFLNLKQK